MPAGLESLRVIQVSAVEIIELLETARSWAESVRRMSEGESCGSLGEARGGCLDSVGLTFVD